MGKTHSKFPRLKFGSWDVWNYERGNFFGKSIFRLGKMLTSVKIEHLKSSIKNSEFRFRLIAAPFVKNSKIQDRKIRKKFKWLELDCLHLFLHTNEKFEERKITLGSNKFAKWNKNMHAVGKYLKEDPSPWLLLASTLVMT